MGPLRAAVFASVLVFAPIALVPDAGAQAEGGVTVKVFVLAGQSNMVGYGQVRSLPQLGEHPQHGHWLGVLRDDTGAWRKRDDVFVSWPGDDDERQSGPLTVGLGANSELIGPELLFGAYMGERFTEPVLLIKTAWGGKDVHCDFRSPGAGAPDGDAAKKLAEERERGEAREVGASYRRMLSDVRAALASLDELMPGHAVAGYELAGFVWFQGWNDYCHWHDYPGLIDDYPRHLAAMVADVRKELGAPALPVVIGELGIGGDSITERAQSEHDREARALQSFRDAQRRAVTLVPGAKFVPTAAHWDTRLDELREASERWESEKRRDGIADTEDNLLPTRALSDEYRARGGHWYCHYNGSAATYSLIGLALAEALVPAPVSKAP